jgi:hypothetical protein
MKNAISGMKNAISGMKNAISGMKNAISGMKNAISGMKNAIFGKIFGIWTPKTGSGGGVGGVRCTCCCDQPCLMLGPAVLAARTSRACCSDQPCLMF